MRPNPARYSFLFFLNHWIIILLSLIVLGSGWYLAHAPKLEQPARDFLLGLHTSFGLTGGALIIIQIFLLLLFKLPAYTYELSKWQRTLGSTLYFLIYLSFGVMVISGYFWALFSETPVRFWGATVPRWEPLDWQWAGFVGAVHGIAAFVLAGSIFVDIGSAGLAILRRPRGAAPALVAAAPQSRETADAGGPGEPRRAAALRVAQKLARNLRLLGWIAFWLQLALGVASGVLLQFAKSGRAFGGGTSGFGDAIYWGIGGFFLLCAGVVLAFSYTRAARKIILRPQSYLGETNRAFWFLGAGVLTASLGVIASFVGVALSVLLLIVKTVSQPPGVIAHAPTFGGRAAYRAAAIFS